MQVHMIAAQAANGAIGANNALLWHIPEDLKFFKKTTMGCPVIMGRKTWESLGRALPGRINIVVTKNRTYEATGAQVVTSLEEAFERVGHYDKVFVIGGAQIYRQAMRYADVIWLTRVDQNFEADAYFPTIPRGVFWGRRFDTLPARPNRPYRVDFYVWTRR